jgi:hypothetical protein
MMKYLRHKTFGFVLFEKRHRHDAMARRLGMDVKDITGAGVVVLVGRPNSAMCAGGSLTLGMKSGKHDVEDLRKEMG